jgi:hypothetical protein
MECGAELDGVPADAVPRAELWARSGEPNVRVLTVHGKEVHRCVPQLDQRRAR